jgi:hypothetical protein
MPSGLSLLDVVGAASPLLLPLLLLCHAKPENMAISCKTVEFLSAGGVNPNMISIYLYGPQVQIKEAIQDDI